MQRCVSRTVGIRIGASIEESLREIHVAAERRDQQRGAVVGPPRVDVGAGHEQHPRQLHIAATCREQERRKLTRRMRIDVRALIKERSHDVPVSFRDRPHQRGLTFGDLCRVHVRASGKQRLHDVHVARERRRHQHGFSRRKLRVGIRAGLQQRLDDLRARGAAVLAGHGERRHAVIVGRVDLGAGVNQQLDSRHVVPMSRPVKCCGAVGLSHIRVNAFGEESFRSTCVAVLDSLHEPQITRRGGCNREQHHDGATNRRACDRAAHVRLGPHYDGEAIVGGFSGRGRTRRCHEAFPKLRRCPDAYDVHRVERLSSGSRSLVMPATPYRLRTARSGKQPAILATIILSITV